MKKMTHIGIEKEKLINNVIFDLSQTPNNKTPESIRKLIVHFATNPLNPIDLNEDDVENIAKQIENKFGLKVEIRKISKID